MFSLASSMINAGRCSSVYRAAATPKSQVLHHGNMSQSDASAGRCAALCIAKQHPRHSVCKASGVINVSTDTSSSISPAASTSTSSANGTNALYESYERCMNFILYGRVDGKAHGSSRDGTGMQTPMLPPDVDAVLRRSCREGDHWLLIYCGVWEKHPEGWEGPAMGVLQAWQGVGGCDYILWEVGANGLPTGCIYNSGTALEKLTNKAGSKKFTAMCSVPGPPTELSGLWSDVKLNTWLKRTFGLGSKFQSKAKKSAQMVSTAPLAAASCRGTAHPDAGRSSQSSAGQGTRRRVSRSKAAGRLATYTGVGALPPGNYAQAALDLAKSAAGGPPPAYLWPQQMPAVLPAQLHMAESVIAMKEKLLHSIAVGNANLADTHVPLKELYPGLVEPNNSSSSSNGVGSISSAAVAAGTATTDGDAAQVYDIRQLEQRAAAGAAVGAAAGSRDAAPPQLAVVPDATRPFTLTMRNPADGQHYVVAHYEPHALSYRPAEKAALLCEVYHGRSNGLKMIRTSAPDNEAMVMAGMRVPRSGLTSSSAQYGRYSGDEGPEPDQFSFTCWPDLSVTGGFRSISYLWQTLLPGLVCQMNKDAAARLDAQDQAPGRGRLRWKGPTQNYPTPCLLGGPFTTLAVTQNYHSLLHCEPGEHPFSFITWLDVLAAGSQMEVGYFWLTNGLAFTPLNGSALYIDVRLVTHCSDPSTVHQAKSRLEGRYGAALFIKPDVVRTNTQAWAAFNDFLQLKAEERAGQQPNEQHVQEQGQEDQDQQSQQD